MKKSLKKSLDKVIKNHGETFKKLAKNDTQDTYLNKEIKMNIYILMHSVDWEGSDIEGVFSTKEKALTYAKQLVETINSKSTYYKYELREDKESWNFKDSNYYIITHVVDEKLNE